MNKQFYTEVLRDLAEATAATENRIYVFAGFTIDIWQSEILRDHHDVDIICVDFWVRSKEIASFFEERGYKIIEVPNGDLKIKKNDFGISMTNCEIKHSIAKWSPYGVKGSIYFPADWLNDRPYLFEGFNIYTVDKRFEYCLKNSPRLFNPDWEVRDHSAALNYLKKYFSDSNISVESFINEMYLKSE